MMQQRRKHDSTAAETATASRVDAGATAVYTSRTPTTAGAGAVPSAADNISAAFSELLSGCVEGTKSKYLEGKGLSECAAGYPVTPDGRTVIPLRNASGAIVAFQTISADGRAKRFSGTAAGAYHIINQQEQPERIIIAEGLATALSVHQLQNDSMVVMAGSASNLSTTAVAMRERHPEAWIVIAADNDNVGKGRNENVGKYKAEEAAIAVGGAVALAPAGDGEKCDWNDILVREGREAAVMHFSGSMYQPESTEKTAARKSRKPRSSTSDGDSGVVVEETSNGPMMRLLLRDTSLDICQKVDVVGYGIHDGNEYRVLRWVTRGDTVTVAVCMGDFASSAAATTLMNYGLLLRNGKMLHTALTNWILEQGTTTRWTLAASAGWTGDDFRAYILPDGQVIGGDTPVLFMGKSAAAGGWSVGGTVDTWRASVARLAEGNSLMMVCIAAAFAGPLLKLAGISSFGVHLYGPTTTGKTTCARLAASVCGNPDTLKLSWNGTVNGILNEAAARCDGLLWLDELGEGRPEDIAGSIYSLLNGTGRIRATRDGNNAPHTSWRTPAISTGEADTETFTRAAGITLAPGALIRLLNIPVDRIQPENLHGYRTTREHADALTTACRENYGAVFREWVAWLTQNRQAAADAVSKHKSEWNAAVVTRFPDSTLIHRVTDAFVALDAALTLTQRFTGWSEDACRRAVLSVFATWVKNFGAHDKAQSQIISQAADFLMQYGRSRFATLTTDGKANAVTDQEARQIHVLYGYRKPADGDNGDEWFYVTPDAFRRYIAKGHNYRQAAAALEKAGMLEREPGSETRQSRLRIGGSQQRFYKVKLLDAATDE
ncbi:DUF927 domain-containing protein [Escherichia coli]|uniref:TOPRIM and DUF927 domain-containing protein n=1 Tax=Escherichia coli TaxID=562 RepID=UPI0010E08CAC|nr:DUF927 domain-containing protein [Escherichia coli]EJK8610344.1 DUF927 domain-containing protein [Escherichia coli]EKF0226936.1 DUF927 domain-containing protein [Escherichia coli]GDJ23555.1 phage DNA replication protein [Escherichia coli]